MPEVDHLGDDERCPRPTNRIVGDRRRWPARRAGRAATADEACRRQPGCCTRGVGEEAEQQRADEAADQVDGDDVEASSILSA